MIESVKRVVYLFARNSTALILIQVIIDFLIKPIGYVVGVSRHVWHALTPWEIKMMFTSAIQKIGNFALLAILLIMFYESLRMSFVAYRFISVLFRRFSLNS